MKIHFINEKYLPSKKFALIVGVGSVLVAGIFLLFFTFTKGESFATGGVKNNSATGTENQTINDLIQKDSDGDGIPDWEEALWGTDENNSRTFDMPDSLYIENKKKELNIEQNVNITKLTETEKFAREFFSGFTAMTASGEVDQDTINSFSNALGQKIVNPSLINQYTEADIKIDINGDNDPSRKYKYYAEIKALFEGYQKAGIGDELDIVNSGLVSFGATATDPYSQLPIIADAYQGFAEDVMKLVVPSELSMYHLQIANGANNTGISVQNMREIIRDPLVGLEGISQYQKYSEDLIKAVADLENVLTQ